MEARGGRRGWPRRIAVAWLTIVAALVAPAVGVDPPALQLSPEQGRVFQQICASCHARPDIGVPLVGDDAAWEPRRAKGLDVLVRNTIDGFGRMPPLGTCSFCSEADLRQLVAYLAGLPAAGSGDAP